MVKTLDFVNEVDAKNEQADGLLMQIVKEGRQPSYSELQFFESVGIERLRLPGQLGRVSSVLRFQAISGTHNERQAAERDASECEKIFTSEGEKLKEKIAKLQSQYDQLERDARLKRKRHDEMVAAVEQLRGLVPTWITANVEKTKYNLAMSAEGQALTDTRSRRDCLRTFLAMPVDHDSFKPCNHTAIELLINELPTGHELKQLDNYGRWSVGAWQRHCDECLKPELAELEGKVASMQAEYDDECTAISAGLVSP